MTSPFRLRYADSSLLLALLNEESIAADAGTSPAGPGSRTTGRSIAANAGTTRFTVALRIFQNAAAGNYRLLTSVLSIAEVRTTPGGTVATYLPQSRAGIFGLPYLHLADVDETIAFAAQRLGDEYGLKPPDAIHLATAIQHACAELLVWDDASSAASTAAPSPACGSANPTRACRQTTHHSGIRTRYSGSRTVIPAPTSVIPAQAGIQRAWGVVAAPVN